MLEAIDKSFSKLDPADIAALATYIGTVPARTGTAAPGKLASAAPVSNDLALMAGTASPGAALYDKHCATCHGASGEGGNGLPALAGNAALKRPTADNAVMAVLGGLTPGQGQAMPAFADRLDNGQIATLVNYLQSNFGDTGVQTSAARVAELRAGGAPSQLLKLAQQGMIAAGVVIVVLIVIVGFVIMRRRNARS